MSVKRIPINKKQITVIKIAVRALDIPDEDYRDMLEDRFQVRSCTKLSYRQAMLFIRELEEKGFELRPRKNRVTRPKRSKQWRGGIARGNGNVVALVCPDELDKINAVAELIAWQYADGLQRFLAARLKIKDGLVRTSQDAYLAIEGLKKLFENHMKKLHGPAWWAMEFPDPRIAEYISIHCPVEFRKTIGLRIINGGMQQ